MSLGTGTRLGPYEIQSALGAGGMGEVYRARDTQLNRDVALKVLPELFAADADRLARFKREAQVLASLNHPNIAAIYGLEEADGVRALVLELVEGSTLADRIARGPIPLDEALPIARQIADALEAAHEQGVVHRDLKPANVKLRPDGTAKVLDFGLAKAFSPAEAGHYVQHGDDRSVRLQPDLTASPTITSPAMTRMGVILGTATYMAPEQARGRTVDKRADIWAFGCVLFEMLTGTRAFDGEDVAETLGAVIHKEPAWSALPADTPPYLRTLLRRCLQKDPKKRLPHIGVARIEIDEGPADAAGATPVMTAPAPRGLRNNARVAWVVAGLSIAAAIALAMAMSLRREAVDTRVTRAAILPPAGAAGAAVPGSRFTLSPDGRRLAFLGTDGTGTRLWVRPIEALTAQPLAGTEGVVIATWSPDSRFLAFMAGGRLRKIDATGGPPITLADKATVWGLAWSAEDAILFAPEERGPLFRVSASGGASSQVTMLDPASGDAGHGNPFFLPDGRHFLYLARGSTTNPNEARAVFVGSLDPAEVPRLLLQQGGSNAQYASGYLLFLRETTLMAQPFDADRLELAGEAVPLADQLQVGGLTGRNGAFSVSQTGTLVYQTGSADIRSRLVWFDRGGKQIDTLGEPADQMSVELSPDGTRALVSLLDQARRARDLWIYDVRRGLRTRFTFNPANEVMGAWSPDGSRVVFNSQRPNRFDLYQKASSGAGVEELLLSDDQGKEPYSWSQDGRFVAYHSLAVTGGGTAQNLWTVPLTGDRKPLAFLQTEFGEVRPHFSPDGRWLAYASNESGRFEVYVTPFPDRSGKWQVSTAGGNWPRWRRDGKELFYLAPDNTLMAAAVSGGGAAFQVGEVQRLFEVRPRLAAFAGNAGYWYDVSVDGQRFLVNALFEETSVEPITLLVNWPALLTSR